MIDAGDVDVNYYDSGDGFFRCTDVIVGEDVDYCDSGDNFFRCNVVIGSEDVEVDC